MRAPIHSVKHYKQMSRSTVTTVTVKNERLIIAVQSTLANLEDEVREGAIVKAVYVELWLLDSSNDGSFVLTIGKDTANSQGPTFGEMNTLFNYVEKKGIFYTSQGLTQNDGVTSAVPIVRGWFKIPKSKQRFGLGDTLNLNIANNGAGTIEYCGFATYKEYT